MKFNYIDSVKNAQLLPVRKNDFGGGVNGKVLFGVFDKNNNKYYNHVRGRNVWEDMAAREKFLSERPQAINLSGAWLFGGPLFFHFGHFLSESISRLWAYRNLINEVDGIVFFIPPYMKNPKLPNYMIECFNLLGIKKQSIKLVNEYTKVDSLFIPEQGTILSVGAKSWYDEKLIELDVKSKIEFKSNKNSIAFFSRRNFKLSGRNMGWGYFEKSFSKNVEVIFPEEIPLIEQLKKIYTANILVFEEGSSIHLLDLLPKLNKKIIFVKRRVGFSYLENLLENKAAELVIYNDIKESPLIFKNDARHNVCSRFSKPESFFSFLKTIKVIDDFNNFDARAFIEEEEKDINNYLLDRIKADNEYFR